MALDLATLMDEAKCLCAAGASDAQKVMMALLQRIAEATAGQPRVYRALLTQAGNNAPVATILENTLGGTPTWAFVAQGQYSLNLTGAFTALTAISAVNDTQNSTDANVFHSFRVNDNQVKLYTLFIDLGGPAVNFTNGLLNATFFELRVYP